MAQGSEAQELAESQGWDRARAVLSAQGAVL